MLDSLTHKRVTVISDENSGHYIAVQTDQVDSVREILDHAGVMFEVTTNAAQFNGSPTVRVITFDNADSVAVQQLLDEANVKVSVNFVDGGYTEYYESNDLIDRYEYLKQEGLEGKILVHELLTDDWGPPPVGITLEGETKNGGVFHAYIPYS